jgi:hypothetical protein
MIRVRTVQRAQFFANQTQDASLPSLTCWSNERHGQASGNHRGPGHTEKERLEEPCLLVE